MFFPQEKFISFDDKTSLQRVDYILVAVQFGAKMFQTAIAFYHYS